MYKKNIMTNQYYVTRTAENLAAQKLHYCEKIVIVLVILIRIFVELTHSQKTC